MNELALSILVNAALGLVLLFALRRDRAAAHGRLDGPDAALRHFAEVFPDATGHALVGDGGDSALIALSGDAGVGLVERHGRRWNARRLERGEIRALVADANGTLHMRLTDFAWPAARIRIADDTARNEWLARLRGLMASSALTRAPGATRA
jgi:hypothetical protein